MDNYVDKTSKQNISGVKTITGDGWNLYMKSNSISYNTAPSSWLNKTIAFVDKNGGSFGAVEIAKDPENINNIYLNVFSPKGSWCPIPLGLRAASDGNFGSTAPKCNWDNSIVTTVSHGSNYVRFGNGIQICFGNVITNNNTQTVTYAQPFKEANPNLTLSLIDVGPEDSRYWQAFKISEEKNTGFKITGPTEISRFGWIAIGYWY